MQLLITALIVAVCSPANAAQISNLRIGQGIGNVRVVFDADSQFDYKVFLLNEPRRLVVDTQNIEVNSKIEKATDPNNLISSTRLGNSGIGGVRMVFDLSKPVIIKKVFMLPPQSNFSWRFVIDLEVSSEREFASKVGNDYAFSNNTYDKGKTTVKKMSSSKAAFTTPKSTKKVIANLLIH